MASADLYGAVTTFLAGDSGDIRAAVNAEQTGLIPGSVNAVTVTRGSRKGAPKRPNAAPLTVEIVRVASPRARQVGIGWLERDVAFDLEVSQRLKSVNGATQDDVLEKVTRAIVARYDGVSNLTIPVTSPPASTAALVRSSAEVSSADESELAEVARAVVRVIFTFMEEQASNA